MDYWFPVWWHPYPVIFSPVLDSVLGVVFGLVVLTVLLVRSRMDNR